MSERKYRSTLHSLEDKKVVALKRHRGMTSSITWNNPKYWKIPKCNFEETPEEGSTPAQGTEVPRHEVPDPPARDAEVPRHEMPTPPARGAEVSIYSEEEPNKKNPLKKNTYKKSQTEQCDSTASQWEYSSFEQSASRMCNDDYPGQAFSLEEIKDSEILITHVIGVWSSRYYQDYPNGRFDGCIETDAIYKIQAEYGHSNIDILRVFAYLPHDKYWPKNLKPSDLLVKCKDGRTKYQHLYDNSFKNDRFELDWTEFLERIGLENKNGQMDDCPF